tara:strand:- start:745 stop:1125 length:381 start_codon:yes stop_codon:yes gene_type:complete
MNCINIYGYNGRYEIDRAGDVYSNLGKRKKLKTFCNKKGYTQVVLTYKKKQTRFRIDTLIDTHFIDTNDNSGYISYADLSSNWLFQIRINGKLIYKYLNTKEEAIEYKKEFLKSIITDEIILMPIG